jgi:hypothetical protein
LTRLKTTGKIKKFDQKRRRKKKPCDQRRKKKPYRWEGGKAIWDTQIPAMNHLQSIADRFKPSEAVALMNIGGCWIYAYA